MPNSLGLAGATLSKPARFASIFTSRFFSGLWTNRSPLRDATTSRIVERFYGQAGDALIDGLNVEITNKLTLARRPGTTIFYDTTSSPNIDRFYSFRLFSALSPTLEEIQVIIDQANAIYSLYGGVKTQIFAKGTGAGQAYFQSVGDILYFGDGVETQKNLQTLFTWTANTNVGTATTPFYSTYMFDANGKILQLVGTAFPITGTTYNPSTIAAQPNVTVTSSVNLSTLLVVGQQITFPAAMAATYLENQNATILSISGTTMVVTFPLPYIPAGIVSPSVEAAVGFSFNGGTPTTGTTAPIATDGESITVGANNVKAITVGFGIAILPIAGLTLDGSAMWVSRSNSTGPTNGSENIGIDNSKPAPIVTFLSPNAPLGIGNQQVALYSSFPPSTGFGAGSYVVDINNNIQYTAAGGTSGTAPPQQWSKILGQNTTDGTITWTLAYLGALSTFNGGYQYGVALVNTLDNTVSNILPLSNATGNFTGVQGIQLEPGSGLNTGTASSPLQSIDPQADYVAIFRTTDGQSTPFLIPGNNGQTWTVPLSVYLTAGYNDTTQDTQLNNLISGPILNENTPVQAQAINFVYHLNRLWYSIGNTVWYTSGPDTPVGNGLNGYNPLNFDSFPSIVKRLVPTAAGLIVFTVSDVYIIQGNGTSSNPIQQGIPLLPGIGLLSYNALDMNGPVIGLFTTDNQFIILDPSAGTTYAGAPIGDQLRLVGGGPGKNWNPANVYVAWHVNGEDAAWYVCDGTNGWYRLMTTPAPESGYTWSPFAAITGGAGAVQSIETTPGVHNLLIASSTSILARNNNVFVDRFGEVHGDIPYPANATIGSIVLTQPGQIAEVPFMVTDAVKTGSPLSLGILVDEALPYYTGPIDVLTDWVPDPPNLKSSKSFYSQRFYLDQMNGQDNTAAMRTCQVQIIFSPFDSVQNELLTFSIYGSYSQEL